MAAARSISTREHTDPLLGKVLLRKSPQCRRISVRVSRQGEIKVNIPRILPYSWGIAFLESKREWVRAAVEKQRALDEAHPAPPPLTKQETEILRSRAKETLPQRVDTLAQTHGFRYGTLRIKNNKTNWGSCSAKCNINLNLRLVTLPEHLRDYVILHELCHLEYLDHGKQFHALLEKVCPGHLELRRELRQYPIR